jgi:hypothetical protein
LRRDRETAHVPELRDGGKLTASWTTRRRTDDGTATLAGWIGARRVAQGEVEQRPARLSIRKRTRVRVPTPLPREAAPGLLTATGRRSNPGSQGPSGLPHLGHRNGPTTTPTAEPAFRLVGIGHCGLGITDVNDAYQTAATGRAIPGSPEGRHRNPPGRWPGITGPDLRRGIRNLTGTRIGTKSASGPRVATARYA